MSGLKLRPEGVFRNRSDSTQAAQGGIAHRWVWSLQVKAMSAIFQAVCPAMSDRRNLSSLRLLLELAVGRVFAHSECLLIPKYDTTGEWCVETLKLESVDVTAPWFV